MPVDVTSTSVLGFKVTHFTVDSLLDAVGSSIAARRPERTVIVSMNMHGLYLYLKTGDMRELHRRAQVRIDGTPIYWLARLAGARVSFENRIAWLDLFWPLMRRAARDGWRIFFLGAKPAVLEEGLRRIRAELPDLEIEGHHGYFDARPDGEGNREIVRRINAHAPDLLIVGMGMPLQEQWVARNMDALGAPVIMTAGACIEYIAGHVSTPPRWLGPLGLEWTWRLGSDPRRFAVRYLLEPIAILGMLVTRKFGHRAPRSETASDG